MTRKRYIIISIMIINILPWAYVVISGLLGSFNFPENDPLSLAIAYGIVAIIVFGLFQSVMLLVSLLSIYFAKNNRCKTIRKIALGLVGIGYVLWIIIYIKLRLPPSSPLFKDEATIRFEALFFDYAIWGGLFFTIVGVLLLPLSFLKIKRKHEELSDTI